MVRQKVKKPNMHIPLPGMEPGQQAKKGVEREMHGEQASLPLSANSPKFPIASDIIPISK
jgi:hypothetical protein